MTDSQNQVVYTVGSHVSKQVQEMWFLGRASHHYEFLKPKKRIQIPRKSWSPPQGQGLLVKAAGHQASGVASPKEPKRYVAEDNYTITLTR